MDVKILYPGRRQEDGWTLSKAAATVFKVGQLVSFESGNAVHMDAAGEDATFGGVVGEGADDTKTEVFVWKRCQIEIDLVSAAYTPSQTLAYSAGGSATDYSLTDAGGSNAMARAAQAYPAGTTRGRVNIDVDELNKLPTALEA